MLLETTSQENLSADVKQPALAKESAAVWATTGRFAVFLGLLIFATFPSVLLGTQSFAFRDFGLFGYPLAAFHRQCFWRGELPLWDPLNHCGLPFLAQWNTMTLYPGSLIYLLLPMPWSVSFFCLAHLFWGGLGTYMAASDWTRHRLAGALAGVVFAFNGVMLGSLIWPSQIATFAWAPWTIWLVQRGWRQGRRYLVWGVIAGAMQMLAGGAETILLTWCLLCVMILADLATNAELRKTAVWRFCGIALLVAIVCAAQLLPFLQLVTESQRGSGYGAETWAMPLSGWANFLVPMFGTFPSKWGVYLQKYQLWLSSYYLGVGTLFLILVGIRRTQSLQVKVLAAVACLTVILAMGENTPVYRALYACFPAIGIARFPVKFVIITAVVAPLLAAFGLKSQFEEKRKIGRFEISCAGGLLLLIGAVIFLEKNSSAEEWRLTLQSALSRAAILAVIVVLLGFLFRSDSNRRALWGTLLLAVFWLDFLTHMPSQNPTISPAVYSADWVKAGRNWKEEPKVGQTRVMISPQAREGLLNNFIPNLENNYLIERLALFLDCNLLEGIPHTHGFFPLTPQKTDTVAEAPFVLTNQNFSALYDFMGVSEFLGPEFPNWTPRSSAMPWVTIGQQPVCGNDALSFQAFSKTNTDFRKVVFVPIEAQHDISATAQPDAKVLSTKFSNEKVSIQSEGSAPSMVVISQSYYPAWRAYIDGQPTKLWRANFAFQALQVPAGQHQIELRYKDRAFSFGLLLSALGLAVCGCLYFLFPSPKSQGA